MTAKPITPHAVKIGQREYWRVNIPRDVREAFHGKKTRHFKHKAAADDFAADMAGWCEPLSGALAMEKTLETIAGHPLIVEAAIRNQAKQNALKESGKVGDVVETFLEAKRKAGIRANSLASLTCSLKSFTNHCQKPIAAITPEDIEAWLNSGDYAAKTRKNRHTDLKNLFGWCKRRGLIDIDPMASVDAPRVAFKLFSVCDGRRGARSPPRTSRALDQDIESPELL